MMPPRVISLATLACRLIPITMESPLSRAVPTLLASINFAAFTASALMVQPCTEVITSPTESPATFAAPKKSMPVTVLVSDIRQPSESPSAGGFTFMVMRSDMKVEGSGRWRAAERRGVKQVDGRSRRRTELDRFDKNT